MYTHLHRQTRQDKTFRIADHTCPLHLCPRHFAAGTHRQDCCGLRWSRLGCPGRDTASVLRHLFPIFRLLGSFSSLTRTVVPFFSRSELSHIAASPTGRGCHTTQLSGGADTTSTAPRHRSSTHDHPNSCIGVRWSSPRGLVTAMPLWPNDGATPLVIAVLLCSALLAGIG